jgi:glycerol-3-phosphate dehydrogenase subunit B
MIPMHDLVVIGAGLAGLSAALTAAEAGLRVQVVSKGLSSTHWHTGAVDLLGYLPGVNEAVQKPLRSFDTLPAEHPYGRLGLGAVESALAAFQRWLAESGLGYEGAATPGNNLWLPSPVGAPRPTYLAPAAQRAGDLSRSEPLVIVGLRGMRDFFPTLIAENLRQCGHSARALFVPLGTVTQRRDFTTVQLAEALDDARAIARLAAAVRPLLRVGERVGLPAILGLQGHSRRWQELQEQLDSPVFEIPTLPPSVPGIRLDQFLRHRLHQLGIRVQIGMEAVSFDAADGRILSVSTATSARPLRHRAERFLLATGGFLGGGFHSDHTGRCWEVLFDLPLTTPADRSEWFHHHFLHPAGQPLFSSGVAVNEQWQPVAQDGQPVYHNLWAAGGLLAHTDPIRERSLEGIAVATGVAAGQAILQWGR